ncbi:MAG: T9SS type A sorting domain-containing protein [Bacteroidia bacterium]|nr:T9SS type A sorting domain-containing protein [Bacteroidia bacterium]
MKKFLSLVVFLTISGTAIFGQQLSLNFTSANVSCYGVCNGSITATVSGGTIPYTYVWNDSNATVTPTIYNLCAGTYTVIVTDAAQNTVSGTVTISQPVAISATLTPHNPTSPNSNDGYITTTVSGGTPPYTYLWIPGQMMTPNIYNLTSGTYTLYISDANGCSSSFTIQLVDASPTCHAAFSYQADTTYICYFTSLSVPDSSSTITSYFWDFGDGSSSTVSNPVHPLNSSGGIVCLTITTSSGCTSAFCDSVYVNNNPCQIYANFITHNPTFMGGSDGYIETTVSGGTPPYTYSWNNGAYTTANIYQLSSGTYSLIVTDANGCSINSTVQLLDPNTLSCQAYFYSYVDSISVPPMTAYYFVDQSVPDSNSTILNWNWTFSGGTPATSTVHNPSGIIYQMPGTYNICLTITTSSGCTSTFCDTIFVNNNPCQLFADIITQSPTTIGGNDGFIETSISGGTAPYTFSWNTGQTAANIYNLTSGIYTLEVFDANGCYNYFTAELYEPYDTAGGNMVDTLFTDIVDTCFNAPVDSFYITQITINNNNTVTVEWVFIAGGNTYTITAIYNFSFIGNQIVIITLDCGGFKTLSTYMSYIHINSINGVTDISNTATVSAYPVPVGDNLNIEMSLSKQAEVSLSIQNITGQIIYHNTVAGNSGNNLWKIDTQKFANGLYILSVAINGKLQAVKKINK